MTERDITALGPAFGSYLRRYQGHFAHDRTAKHVDTYCRGSLPDLPRKSVEPIALAAGTAVRTLQEFLVTSEWAFASARDTLPAHLGAVRADLPADPVGTIGVIDETRCREWGAHTPGGPRQYLGCVGKVDSGIVTVHVGVATGTSQALLDADPFLPTSWSEDRPRCRAAGIPDAVKHRTKWRLALGQLIRLNRNGMSFDGLTSDEGYGAAVPFLRCLTAVSQRFVAEVPVNFSVRDAAAGPARRADARLTAAHARGGTRHRVAHRTVAASFWRAARATVWVADQEHALVAAINEGTGELRYFPTNAATAAVARVLGVAFRRWAVERGFRLAKQEAGRMDDEGRNNTGRMRHLTLALVVLGFVATHAERLRGEKPTGDGRASVPGVEPAVRRDAPPTPGRSRNAAHQQRHSLPPAAERSGGQVTQETAESLTTLKAKPALYC